MSLNITGVKVSLDDALDISDALSCLGYPGELRYCPGQRITPDGYTCVHCGADPSAGDKCKSSREKALETMKKEIEKGDNVLQPPTIFD